MLKENEVAKTIVDVAYHIHRRLGPGLLESVYHAIMKDELEKRGLRVLSRELVPVVFFTRHVRSAAHLAIPRQARRG
jgi:GxxExxY protein